jgi:hypothetical protein
MGRGEGEREQMLVTCQKSNLRTFEKKTSDIHKTRTLVRRKKIHKRKRKAGKCRQGISRRKRGKMGKE